VELFIEINEEVEGVDLLICKQCWGVGVTAKSMELVMSEGSLLDTKRDEIIKSSGDCKCPMCSTIMDEIELEIPEKIREKISIIGQSDLDTKNVIIDSCSSCPTFWFDAGELDLLNGIKPRFRGANRDPTKVRLLEDQTLTEEDLKMKKDIRKGLGLVTLGGAFYGFVVGGVFVKILAAILGIGGLIAIVSTNPKQSLVKGACEKCMKPDKLLAWNCQSGGCWAHICTDCESIGEDPVEAYAKTLGQVAVGTVVAGVAVVALFAAAEAGGGVGLDLLDVGAGSGKKKRKKIDMLLCRECTKRWREETDRNNKEIKSTGVKKKKISDIMADGYCSHKDPMTGKRCRRVVFRDGSYCYIHKELY
jgi:Zn-finger nucleic acid-binding protein